MPVRAASGHAPSRRATVAASRAGALLLLWASAAACGGPGAAEGTVGGRSLPVKEAFFFASREPVMLAKIVLSSREGTCGIATRAVKPSGTTLLELTLQSYEGGRAAGLEPGEYAVGATDGRSVTTATFTAFDDACAGVAAQATGGTVTLDSVAALDEAKGEFSLRFEDQTLEGTFRAAFCAEALPGPAGSCG